MNGSFLIPEKFYLNNKPIDVVIDDDYLNKKKYHGLAVFKKGVIKLCNVFKGKKLPKTVKEETFYHELSHMIVDSFDDGRYTDLKYDENFIDLLASRLYEYEKTKQ